MRLAGRRQCTRRTSCRGLTGASRRAPNTLSILAPPGNYTVRLTVGGVDQTQPLVVRKDPNSGGTEGDIAAQTTRAAGASANDLNQAADAVHRIEAARVQIDAIARTVDDTTVRRVRGRALRSSSWISR